MKKKLKPLKKLCSPWQPSFQERIRAKFLSLTAKTNNNFARKSALWRLKRELGPLLKRLLKGAPAKCLPLLLLLFLSGCTVKNPYLLTPQGAQTQNIRDRYVFIFNIDGAMVEEINQHVAAGLLPKIKELFFDKGARFQNALTVYPTLSAPAHQAFLSGLQPGHHGVPSLDYLSRPLQRYIDFLHPKDLLASNHLLFNFLQVYQDNIVTDRPQLIFEALRDQPTLSILEGFNGGAKQNPKHTSLVHPSFHTYFAKRFAVMDIFAMNHLFKVIEQSPLANFPRLSMVNFYSTDLSSHYQGAQTKYTQRLYRHYDQFFSQLENKLRQKGLWQKTTLVLLADHGQHRVDGRFIQLPKLLSKLGFQINEKNPLKGQVLWADHATGYSNLYFKKDPQWQEPLSYQELRNFPLKETAPVHLPRLFAQDPNIELVLAKGKGFSTELYSATGEAKISRIYRQGQFYYAYQVSQGQDPLGYTQIDTIKNWIKKGQYQNAETWLKATAHLDKPDAVVALASIFDDYRVGDLILNSRQDQQFKKAFVSGHGSLARTDRIVPLFFYGPDINAGLYENARLVDVAPTLLSLFGRKFKAPTDGVIRKEIFTQSFLKEWQALEKSFPTASPGLSTKDFKKQLQSIQKKPEASQEAKEKATALLYILQRFQEEAPL